MSDTMRAFAAGELSLNEAKVVSCVAGQQLRKLEDELRRKISGRLPRKISERLKG
jgi:hypothetical protein